MIEYTFQHISGISALKEKELWRQKILTWADFERKYDIQMKLNFGEDVSVLKDSRTNLTNREADFFTRKLHPHLFYRIAHTFPEKTIFLDIETTGLSRYYDRITVIGWSIMDKYKVHIAGDQKTKLELIRDLENSNCIITFNGSIFDLPFVRAYIPQIRIPLCHIDLRFFCRRVGLQGGQKLIEDTLKLKRAKELKDIDGLEATILWHRFKEGDIDSLKKLIKYNASDVDGMKVIFEKVTRELIKKEGLPINKKHIFAFSKYQSKVEFTKSQKTKGKIYIHKYTGRVGPMVFIDDLPDLGNHKIVGIDLTGSENKASGWALLMNGYAQTRTILSNAELIEETIKLNPSVISIDSPLSLPVGRTSVFDDDPGRNEYGITRECERVMAKRGVKSYPCLIPSMQKLTQRGIHLASEFRRLGYPVIESYPGAAQDILGIPRKRKSMEFLIKGLKSFGIKGDYDKENVTHDEIDAITSALVGYFFLADKFEALGNENEDFLIIPSLENKLTEENKIVIGLSGLLSSGKTTSAKILEKKGFGYGRYSMVVDSYLRKEGKDVNRTALQEMGDYIHRNKGQRWLGKELLNILPSNKNVVIDGLRFPEDHAFLRETFGLAFFHIHITADKERRKERYYTKDLNDKSFEKANEHAVEKEIDSLRNFADVIITNNSSISELEIELNQILEKICQFQ